MDRSAEYSVAGKGVREERLGAGRVDVLSVGYDAEKVDSSLGGGEGIPW